jgi:hypothetical protein
MKNEDELALEVGQRVIDDADALRMYMDETFTASFPIVWAGRKFTITVQMEPRDA